MTNHTHPHTISVPMNPNLEAAGYSTRELEEHAEHLANAPAGSHYANALAFIVDSLADDNAECTSDLRMMDRESLLEFAEMYNFTEESFRDALTKFEQAYLREEKVMRDR